MIPIEGLHWYGKPNCVVCVILSALDTSPLLCATQYAAVTVQWRDAIATSPPLGDYHAQPHPPPSTPMVQIHPTPGRRRKRGGGGGWAGKGKNCWSKQNISPLHLYKISFSRYLFFVILTSCDDKIKNGQ